MVKSNDNQENFSPAVKKLISKPRPILIPKGSRVKQLLQRYLLEQQEIAELAKKLEKADNNYERQTIWRGVLEWNDKQAKDPTEALKSVPCAVTSNAKDGEPEVKVDNWPPKLVMQLLPKALISSIGGAYLKNSTSVLFHPQNCPALEALTKVMSNNFAGCVQFNNSSLSECNLKVLILLYTPDKKVYLGFIPNDQGAFVERLRSLIQQRKNNPNMRKGGPQGLSTTGSQTPASNDNVQGQPGHMGGGMMPVPNMNNPLNGQQPHMGGIMVGALPHGGVNPADAMMQSQSNQQSIMHQNPNQMNVPQGPMGLRGTAIHGPRPPLNDNSAEMRLSRQENLARIHQLRQTLAAAQQQELQYQQTQLEVHQPPYGRHQMVNRQTPPQQTQPVRSIHSNAVQTAPQPAAQFDDVNNFEFI